jgi:hypothetical protein
VQKRMHASWEQNTRLRSIDKSTGQVNSISGICSNL